MQTIQFTSEELEVLRDVLRHLSQEIDVEVFRTDTHDFKLLLKHRKDILDGIANKLEAVPAAA